MIVFTIIGIVAVALLVGWVILTNLEIGRFSKGDGFIFTLFNFGFVYAKPYTVLKDNLNKVRGTKDKAVFINAPRWFNRYVWNIGGVKIPIQPKD